MPGNVITAPSQLPINRANDSGIRALQQVQFMLVEIDVTTARERNDRCPGCFLC